LSYEIKEYLIPLVAMDAMVVAMFELQRISMVQLAHNHSTHNRLETLILDFIPETRPNSTVRLQACMSGRKFLFLFGGNHIAWSCILRILLSRFQKPSSILILETLYYRHYFISYRAFIIKAAYLTA